VVPHPPSVPSPQEKSQLSPLRLQQLGLSFSPLHSLVFLGPTFTFLIRVVQRYDGVRLFLFGVSHWASEFTRQSTCLTMKILSVFLLFPCCHSFGLRPIPFFSYIYIFLPKNMFPYFFSVLICSFPGEGPPCRFHPPPPFFWVRVY